MQTATNAGCSFLTPDAGEQLQIFDEQAIVKVVGSETAGAYAFLILSVAPGGGPPLHAHTGSETVYVVSGEFEFTMRDAQGISTVRAGPGALIHAPSGAAHRFQNISPTRSTLLLILSPEIVEYLRELASVFPQGAQPDAWLMQAVSAKYHTEILSDA